MSGLWVPQLGSPGHVRLLWLMAGVPYTKQLLPTVWAAAFPACIHASIWACIGALQYVIQVLTWVLTWVLHETRAGERTEQLNSRGPHSHD